MNDSGPGSLRQAILDLPNCSKPCDVIFNIEKWSKTGYWTIEPLTPRPPIWTDQINIDGRTQTWYSGDTNPDGPEVVLSGARAGMATGLINSIRRQGGSSAPPFPVEYYTIRGLGFENWQNAAVALSGTLGLYLQPVLIRHITIVENYFGVDAHGQGPAPNGTAIHLGLVEDAVIASNVISGNDDGISVAAGTGVRIVKNNIGMDAAKTRTLGNATIGVIYRNQMFDNGFGIDLQSDGPTLNDTSDLDSGPHDLQNYPVLKLGDGVLRGELDSTPRSDFDVDIYETDLATSNQGRRYLGTITLTTDRVTASGALRSFVIR